MFMVQYSMMKASRWRWGSYLSASFTDLLLFTQVCCVFSNKAILSSSENKTKQNKTEIQEHKQSLVVEVYETSLPKDSKDIKWFLAQGFFLVSISSVVGELMPHYIVILPKFCL